MQTIKLKTPSLQGIVTIGEGVIEERLPALLQGQKNFLVTDSNVARIYKDKIRAWFGDTPTFVLPAGESSKNFSMLGNILDEMVQVGMRRTGRVFALGGGVVGDIAGFAAATYMRGVSCVQIPTTLLSQVDSSVGGKTAVDHGGVKNVVGAFFQPQEVLIDPAFLDTLPAREIKCGLGEIVKYAALDSDIFDTLYQNQQQLSNLVFLKTLICPCVSYKARVVEADEKESGERKCLNVGHTTGHAIELAYHFSHGESVLWGMKGEIAMAVKAGVCEKEHGEKLLSIVDNALQLAPQEKVAFRVEEYTAKAKADKKNDESGNISMAVPTKKGKWTVMSMTYADYVNGLKESL